MFFLNIFANVSEGYCSNCTVLLYGKHSFATDIRPNVITIFSGHIHSFFFRTREGFQKQNSVKTDTVKDIAKRLINVYDYRLLQEL